LHDNPDSMRMGILQGISAGVMIFISFADLMIESTKVVGFNVAYISFFTGVLFMAFVVKYIPTPEWFHQNLSTSLLPQTERNQYNLDTRETDSKFLQTNNMKFFVTGIITAFGISLHNFPEGIAVYLGSLKGLRFGIPLAIAIMIHNLPEGMAVSMPIYFATKSKWYAIRVAFFSGIFEPLGVLVVGLLFGTSITEQILHSLFGTVAGVMTFLVVFELYPLSIKFSGVNRATTSVFVGMGICFLSLSFLSQYENG